MVDDSTGRTLAYASSLSKELKGKDEGDKKSDAKRVGSLIAEKCKAANVDAVRPMFADHAREATATASPTMGASLPWPMPRAKPA